MKLLKYLFLLILIVLLGTAAYVALLDRQFQLSVHTKLKAPRQLVFQQVNKLHNWKNWAALKNDSTPLQVTPSEDLLDDSVFLKWEKDSLDLSGKLYTTAAVHYSSITQKATLHKSFGKMTYALAWTFTDQADSTFITLDIKGKKNFWAKAAQLLNKTPAHAAIEELVHKSLHQLSAHVLKEMNMFSIRVNGVAKTHPQTYVYASLASKNIPEVLAQKRQAVVEKLNAFLATHQLKSTGPAFVLFNTIDQQHGNAIISVGLPIAGKVNFSNPNSNILVGTLPGQYVIKSTLKGNHKYMPKLLEATKAYLSKHHIQQKSGAPTYRIFKVTSKDTENPAEWITELIVPIDNTAALKTIG